MLKYKLIMDFKEKCKTCVSRQKSYDENILKWFTNLTDWFVNAISMAPIRNVLMPFYHHSYDCDTRTLPHCLILPNIPSHNHSFVEILRRYLMKIKWYLILPYSWNIGLLCKNTDIYCMWSMNALRWNFGYTSLSPVPLLFFQKLLVEVQCNLH